MTFAKAFPVLTDEFRDILKYVSVVSVKFHKHGEFYVLPIICVNGNHIDVMVNYDNIKKTYKVGQEVFIKSFRFGFEFILKAKIISIDENSIMRFEFFEVRRIRNYRQFIRYDVNLDANVHIPKKNSLFNISIKDISLDGASFQSDFDEYQILEDALVEIFFDKKRSLKLSARIQRDIKGKFGFSALEFMGIDETTMVKFKQELRAIEKDHLLPLGQVRKFLNKTKTYNKKVAIYSNNCDVIYYLIGLTFLIGITKYEVYNDFRTLKKEVQVDRPDVLLIEIEKMNDDILCVVKYTRERLKNVPMVIILPYNFGQKINIYKEEFGDVTIMHKPILENQLEECLRGLNILENKV